MAANDPLRVPDDFWLRERVQNAVKARDMGSLFGLLKQYLGASQGQTGVTVDLAQGYVSKVMSGERRIVAIDVLERIAIGLRMPDPLRMVMGLAPVDMQASQVDMDAQASLSHPDIAPTVHVVPTQTAVGGEPSYVYGGNTATRTERELIKMAAERAKRFALFSHGGLPSGAVEQVYSDVQQLAIFYPQRSLSEILGELVAAQDNTFALLEQRQRPGDVRQLYLLAGVTGGLLAKASHDLAEPHAAMTQARAAFVCAETAGHDGLCAWLRGLQSLVTYWAGNYQTSLRYAQDGSEYVQSGRGTTAVWLPLNEARAWAALGNSAESKRAIARAENALETVQPDELDELGGICTFGQVRGLYYAADALSWLPSEAAAAEDYASRAVEAYRDRTNPEWAFGDQAGSYCDLAIARVMQGELEGAAEALAPALELPIVRRTNGIVRAVTNVTDAIRNSPLALDPAAAEIRESVEEFSGKQLSGLPR